MSSKIKVDNIADQGNNNLINKCGSTITLGASGDTIELASGASQTGFGRTGTVDWQTGSIKTATFTAANGEGYFCNTTSSEFTVNLPAGSAGAIVSVQDYNNTFDSNGLTISPNGSEKINGGAGGIILQTQGQGLTLVYVDGTVGWRAIQDGDFSNPGSNFIVACGGTETECGDYKIHTFTGPGTFTVTAAAASAPDNVLEYLVVAGGGGGGGQSGNTRGGAGAGGFRFAAPSLAPLTYPAKPLAAPAGITASVQAYPITVGSGGAGSCAVKQVQTEQIQVFQQLYPQEVVEHLQLVVQEVVLQVVQLMHQVQQETHHPFLLLKEDLEEIVHNNNLTMEVAVEVVL